MLEVIINILFGVVYSGVEIKLFYSPNASNFCICRVVYEDHSPLWRVIRQLNTSPVSSRMDASHWRLGLGMRNEESG